MHRLAGIIVSLALSGCALPVNHSIADKPPFNILARRSLITTEVTYLAKEDIHPSREVAPSRQHRYYLVAQSDWPTPTFAVPSGTKLEITDVLHVDYPSLPSYFDTSPYNAILATIVSGPFAGVKIWTFWGLKVEDKPDFVSLR